MPAADSVLWRHLDDHLDDDLETEPDRVGYDSTSRRFWSRCPDCGERVDDHPRSSAAWWWLTTHACSPR